MINKIKIKSIATFTDEVIIDNLKAINFFYGANGSGKTTITRILAKPENFSHCEIDWSNNQKIKTLVYNEDFVREYFYEKDKLNGIYTIGEGAKEIEEKIENKKKEKETLQNTLNNINNDIEEKTKEKNEILENFQETCWQYGYKELEKDFPDFFTGYKKSKSNFANKILDEHNTNKENLLDKEKLKEKYELVYEKDAKKIEEISLINFDELKNIEDNQSILKVSIVGKKDVEIAKMIEKLQNHDWVKQGKKYYEDNYDKNFQAHICPFCQQPTSEEFKKQLEEYFSETYQSKIKELNDYITNYKTKVENLQEQLNNILSLKNKYIDKYLNDLKNKEKIIAKTTENNIQILERKSLNPSEKTEIETISDKLNEINEVIKKVNESIKEHNKLIDNRKTEKEKLEKEIWRFIVNKLEKEVNNYLKKDKEYKNRLDELKTQKNDNENKIQIIDNEISILEKQIKSVKPTVDVINKILEAYGFRGFKLQATPDYKHYQIIREDGSEAKKTLSEGERNFLIFLYFYHLIEGVENPEENINDDKILIIDDPVSSLDSDILFIVSTLIRNILDKIRNKEHVIKQCFIFTHNAYFFKEITFISSRASCYNKRNDTMYYIIRKKDNISSVESYETSPIKTSYQLLWEDIKRNGVDLISVQNSMRRILEFYFKFLAGLNENKLLEKFSNNEKVICKSLIAWINVGSHDIIDDFNISITNEQLEIFKKVFKKIFEETGHIAHYNMMMGIDDQEKI